MGQDHGRLRHRRGATGDRLRLPDGLLHCRPHGRGDEGLAPTAHATHPVDQTLGRSPSFMKVSRSSRPAPLDGVSARSSYPVVRGSAPDNSPVIATESPRRLAEGISIDIAFLIV